MKKFFSEFIRLKSICKKFTKEQLRYSPFLVKYMILKATTLLKKGSNKGVILSVLWNFSEYLQIVIFFINNEWCIPRGVSYFLQAGLIPIHLAITIGQRNIVTELLDSHIDEQLKAVTKDYRDSALHLACRRKDPDMVKFLTDYDAQVNLVNVRDLVSIASDVLCSLILDYDLV